MQSITGIVVDGVKQAQSFTQLGWVRSQVRAKLGFELYPGTLNVRVSNVAVLAEWQARPSIAIEPSPGFCAARCYRIYLNQTLTGAWILPLVPGYANDMIEVIAPVCLRDTLALKTGDTLTIELME